MDSVLKTDTILKVRSHKMLLFLANNVPSGTDYLVWSCAVDCPILLSGLHQVLARCSDQ